VIVNVIKMKNSKGLLGAVAKQPPAKQRKSESIKSNATNLRKTRSA